MNIYEKLSAITEEISAVAKNLEVGFGQNKYKAVGEADVLAAVKPIEAKHGVYSYPMGRDLIENGILENVDSKGNVKKQLYLRLKTTYRFVNLEDPTDSVMMEVFSDGVDPQDKAPGKAMTYGDKYALLKAYKIITGEDPDQYASETLRAKEPMQTANTPTEEELDAQRAAKVAKQPIGETRAHSLASELINNGIDPVKVLAKFKKVNRLVDLTEAQQLNIIQNLERLKKECPIEKEET